MSKKISKSKKQVITPKVKDTQKKHYDKVVSLNRELKNENSEMQDTIDDLSMRLDEIYRLSEPSDFDDSNAVSDDDAQTKENKKLKVENHALRNEVSYLRYRVKAMRGTLDSIYSLLESEDFDESQDDIDNDDDDDDTDDDE